MPAGGHHLRAGIFWRRARETGALVMLVVAVPLGIVGWVLVELREVFSFQFPYVAGVQFVFGSALPKRPRRAVTLARRRVLP